MEIPLDLIEHLSDGRSRKLAEHKAQLRAES